MDVENPASETMDFPHPSVHLGKLKLTTMENHLFEGVTQLSIWQFSIANCEQISEGINSDYSPSMNRQIS